MLGWTHDDRHMKTIAETISERSEMLKFNIYRS